MPGGNRTGPSGFGALTGRGLGYCSSFDSPGFNKGPGRHLARVDTYQRARRLNHADFYESPVGRGMAWSRRGGR